MWQRKVYIGLSGVIILVVLALAIWTYPSLPEKIPTHYNFLGEIDGWGEKSVVWWILAIEVSSFVLVSLLSFFPQIHNYPVKVTDENRETLYRNSSLFASQLTLSMTVTFAYGLLVMLQIVPICMYLFLPYLILAFGVLPVYNIWKMIKLGSA